ncbi:Rrf2 family transcriptional regulator [Bifidobacterium dolichotidis]|nr:Rrf2 family transcriptional regulator [Bifidobacterium dolichotidis]
MQISSRFTMAVHVLVAIDVYEEHSKVTSTMLAESVNANPVVIRRLIQQLKTSGLINVVRGTGGATLAQPDTDITLLDVFVAVHAVDDDGFFHFHELNPKDALAQQMHKLLDEVLDDSYHSLENVLAQVTIADLAQQVQQ